MCTSAHIKAMAAIVLGLTMVSPLAATPAFAAGAPSIVVDATATWTYYATYPDQASCVAAGQTNPQRRSWQCVRSSAAPGAYDLYLWY